MFRRLYFVNIHLDGRRINDFVDRSIDCVSNDYYVNFVNCKRQWVYIV